jgi:hypothetical protein
MSSTVARLAKSMMSMGGFAILAFVGGCGCSSEAVPIRPVVKGTIPPDKILKKIDLANPIQVKPVEVKPVEVKGK